MFVQEAIFLLKLIFTGMVFRTSIFLYTQFSYTQANFVAGLALSSR